MGWYLGLDDASGENFCIKHNQEGPLVSMKGTPEKELPLPISLGSEPGFSSRWKLVRNGHTLRRLGRQVG